MPAVAAQRLFVLYREQRRLADDLASANDRLEGAGLSFATALVAALDARDKYTAGHSACVAVYAKDIAARLGLSEEEQHTAHLAGLVHDIGKVGLPAGLLEKPGPLTLEERRIMEVTSRLESASSPMSTGTPTLQRSFATIMSESMARDTRIESRARTLRSSPESSRWPTPTMR